MKKPAVWFPAIRTGTGTDVFTIRLIEALLARGVRAEIAWLPLRAEYLPWSVAVPKCPDWANVVHINSWLSQRFVPHGLPLVVTVHSSIHDPMLTKYKSFSQSLYHRFWIKQLELQSIRAATMLTAVSCYAASQAEKKFQKSGILPIHNWVNTENFSPPISRKKHEPFRLLFVGNTARKLKGTDLLAPIMELLGRDYELWITGKLIDIPTEGKVPSNVVELGYLSSIDEIVAAYQNCDALLFPTRLEGFGLVALEAQACGLPVITTNASSLPEVVENEVTGLLCPLDDVLAFVNAVRRLGGNDDTRLRMSTAARKRAISLFSESVAIEKYIALYNQLI